MLTGKTSILLLSILFFYSSNGFSKNYTFNGSEKVALSAQDLEGIITSTSGQAVEGATVQILGLDGSQDSKTSTTTNQDGFFSFQDFNSPPPYRVLISHSDYQAKIINIDTLNNEPISISLETAVIDFNFRGLLLDKTTNMLIKGARISYSGNQGTIPETSVEVESDQNGNFTLPLSINLNEEERSFYVSFNHPDYVEMDLKLDYPEPNNKLNIIEIIPPNTSTRSSSNSGLEGIITATSGRAIEGANVQVFGLGGGQNSELSTTTNRRGFFSFEDFNSLPPYRILVSHPDYQAKRVNITSFSNEPLSIALETAVINFNLRGLLLNRETNSPITDARLSYSGRPGAISGTGVAVTSDQTGSFSLPLSINLNQSERNFFISFDHPDYLEMDLKLDYPEPNNKLNIIEISPQNTPISISGKVVDLLNNTPIELATIQVLSDDDEVILTKPIGVATNNEGLFDLSFNMSLPYKLKISHISYETREFKISRANTTNFEAKMRQQSFESGAIVVQASLVAEEELNVPRTFDRVSTVDVQQLASFNVFDLVSSLREVDIATQSLNLQSVTTRGFNTGANPRFLQLTDGVDNQIPGLGFPIGNLLGPSELDIASIDLVVGSASARYGSSALNGVLLTSSKDIFNDEGLTFKVKSGVHSLTPGGTSGLGLQGSAISDASFRYAKAFKSKLGIKVTGSILQGSDWRADNFDNNGFGLMRNMRNDIAGYDGVNTYGDERFVLLATGVDEERLPTGEIAPTTRTGYAEESLVDYDIYTAKVSTELAYKFTENSKFSIDGRYGITNTLYTSDSRIRLQDFEVFQLRSELKINSFSVSAYTTTQRSGSSYNVNHLAEELIQSAKRDSDWYRDFEIAFTRGVPFQGVTPGNLSFSRRFADGGNTLLTGSSAVPRYLPGTERFDEKVNELINIKSFEEGAGIQDNSNLYHVDLAQDLKGIGVTIGTSGRFFDLDSDGTIYPDTVGNNISNYELGGFIQYEGSILNDKIDFTTAVRVDKNENFPLMSSQQLGFNYQASDVQFFRFSIQNSFRFPSVREQFLNTNTGTTRLLGGLDIITDSYELQGNSFFEQSVDEYYQEVTFAAPDTGLFDVTPAGRAQAELEYLPILEDGLVTSSDLQSIKPEKVLAFEVGSRRLFSEKLYLDMNYFVSFYKDFIGIKRFIKPRTSPEVDLYTAATQSINSTQTDRIHVYSNSSSTVIAQGVAMDLRYVSGNFFTGLNGTWSNLISDSNDPIVPGYNTAPFKVNFEWGNRELITNLGFKFNYKYRAAHDWESSFLDGRIDSYARLDFQFNLKLIKARSMLKFGVTNFGIETHNDIYGGPNIGSILFASLTYDPSIF
ncbi:MAG: hypothetical protein BalsKO_22170 [Balneolaceae bacterium]